MLFDFNNLVNTNTSDNALQFGFVKAINPPLDARYPSIAAFADMDG